MLSRTELRRIAKSHLRDADVLLVGERYEGAIYLCGYAVELSLKARICRTLKWEAFPMTAKEFEGLQSLKTHNLDLLLRLSGRGSRIRKTYEAEWATLAKWNPESRYIRTGATSREEAEWFLESTRLVLRVL